MDKLYLVDTNILLDHIEEVVHGKKIVLMSATRRELDKHKNSPNEELSYRARKANRFIFENIDLFHHDTGDYDAQSILGNDYSNDFMDNRILACAVENKYGLITNDLNLYTNAKAFGVEVHTFDESDDKEIDYTGYKEVFMLQDEYQDFYTNRLDVNEFDLNVNEYLIIRDDFTGEVLDTLKYDGQYYLTVKAKSINSHKLGKFTAKDVYQSIAIDSLNSNKFTLLHGKAGSAKTLLALSSAMSLIEKGKYSKLIVFANSLPTKNAAQLGLYKGSLREKLMQVSIGHILASKFGDYNEVEAMMTTGELLILPMSDIRGFDTTGMNACVIISEAQNMDKNLMRLAVERVGSDSKLIVEGDFKQQLDHHAFEGLNNGMRRLSEVFRGEKYYGEVMLKGIYRSDIAKKAQEM